MDDGALLTIAVVVLLVAAYFEFAGAGGAGMIVSSASAASISSGISSEQDVVARTIYGEARGASAAGRQAVASVIRNRVNRPLTVFGTGWIGVCQAPNQFSCWNSGGNANQQANHAATLSAQVGDPAFDACVSVAASVIAGTLTDNTGGALYYYDHSIAEPASWVAKGFVKTVTIGSLTFFKGAA